MTSSNENPCHPIGASDNQSARLFFVSAIHHRKPALGRVHKAQCLYEGSVGDVYFHCFASMKRARVTGDVEIDGTVTFGGSRPQPPPADPQPTSTQPPPG